MFLVDVDVMVVVGRMLLFFRHTHNAQDKGPCTRQAHEWTRTTTTVDRDLMWCTLTGIVHDGSVVLGLDTGQVDRVRVGRAQVRRLGRAVATAAHEAAARALDEAAGHPAQEEELATSALVLALQFPCLCPTIT